MSTLTFMYTFEVNYSDPDGEVHFQQRLQTSRGETESISKTHARILAFCNSYEEGLELNRSRTDPLEPSLWKRDLTNDILTWIEVGCPTEKKILKIVRSHSAPKVVLYFYEESHWAAFVRECGKLDKELLKRITIFQLDPHFMNRLALLDNRRTNWNLTRMDGALYLDIDGVAFETMIEQLNPLDAAKTPALA